MKSAAFKILLSATVLLVSGCASSRLVPVPGDGCSTLVPGEMQAPVDHAVIETTGDGALDWQLYGLAETGQLNLANNNLKAGFAIIRNCEARDARAYAKITAPAWQFWR